LIDTYKVLLPKWVFQSDDESIIKENIERYLQRYPHYYFIERDKGFAICKLNKHEERS